MRLPFALVFVAMIVAGLSVQGCLSARQQPKRFYVLHAEARQPIADEPVLDGLVRVRTLDTDRVYEKFQIVVRRSPYQLGYSQQNVWAVKPNEAISDMIAQGLTSARAFAGVTRQLGDIRPDFTFSGVLHAAEIYDSDDLWYAHLELTLSITRFSDGNSLWSFDYDQRKQVTAGDFGHAVRGISELVQDAITLTLAELASSELGRGSPGLKPPRRPSSPTKVGPEEDPSKKKPEPIYVPEKPVAVPDPALEAAE